MATQGSEPFTQEVRLRAVGLVCREGWSAAQAIGCTTRSVQLWVQKSERGREPIALKTRKAPGAEQKLDRRQKQHLLKLLATGPEAAGFAGQLWTAAKIAELIRQVFDVTYNPRYLPTLLKSLGWSVQKPKRRALERNEDAIEAWVAAGQKKPAGSGRPSFSSTKPGS